MRISIIGTGLIAHSLAKAWVQAGHQVAVAGRSPHKAAALAEDLQSAARGHDVQVVPLAEAGIGRDAVLLAVPWQAAEEVLGAITVSEGTALIDPTVPVEHAQGTMLLESGRSAAETIAARAPGAHVVKAFTMFPAAQWPSAEKVTVAVVGDDEAALGLVGTLIMDAGGVPARLGPLSRARQLEETAGFIIGLAFSGVDPRSAVPQV